MRLSEKQIELLMPCLKKRGYPTEVMTSKYVTLAKPGHCPGRVLDWLRRMSVADASTVMGRLM
jgi:hypothetical protein